MFQNFEFEVIEPFSRGFVVVEQVGFVDLRVALGSCSISGDLASVEGDYNDIDNPSSMIGQPDDVFSAIRAAKVYHDVSNTPSSGDNPPAGDA